VNLVQITPGAGGMFCGNCLRDNALVAALRQLGHSAVMVPLYLPLTLDEEDQSTGIPIFFGGIEVFLEQKVGLFRKVPPGWRRFLASPGLLRRVGAAAARTQPEQLGEITLSMLKGEAGNQAVELEFLVEWLERQPAPAVISLSNALLVGMARQLKARLRVPVVCSLQGEDSFLDALPEPHRTAAWKLLSERASTVDAFVAPSRYFAELMSARLGLPPEKVTVIPNGINWTGYDRPPAHVEGPPVIGYFARMCREKGLELLVEAYRILRRRIHTPVRLRIGGSCSPADRPLARRLQTLLRHQGLESDVEFLPNLSREQKIAFLQSLTVFSVPAIYSEAFGMYVLEALAAGVPVVQPNHAAFPEIIEATGGGLLFEPGNPDALADQLALLVTQPDRARALGAAGRDAVQKKFTAQRMAHDLITLLQPLTQS
jgi:glycosyltransferase involved in cell wall biosynthesis